jgi:hypothetical protein
MLSLDGKLPHPAAESKPTNRDLTGMLFGVSPGEVWDFPPEPVDPAPGRLERRLHYCIGKGPVLSYHMGTWVH